LIFIATCASCENGSYLAISTLT